MTLTEAISEAKRKGQIQIYLNGVQYSILDLFSSKEILSNDWTTTGPVRSFDENDFKRVWDSCSIHGLDRPQLYNDLVDKLFPTKRGNR